MTCSNCKSEDWKLASMVHEEGLVLTNSKSTGVGVGTGGIGVGSAQSSGKQQSIVSMRAAPPEPAMFMSLLITIVSVIAWMIIADLVFKFSEFTIISFGIVLFFLVMFLTTRKPDPVYEKKYADWKKTRMCLRCGTFYLPEEINTEESTV